MADSTNTLFVVECKVYHICSRCRNYSLLAVNLVGIWVALKLLNRERPYLPFLI